MSTKDCQITGSLECLIKNHSCKAVEFKYSCPKCNILYCSVNCYKDERHGNCSEQFFKKCVEEELTLRSEEKSKDDIRKMYDILQRVKEEISIEDFEQLMNESDEVEAEEPEDSDDELFDDDIAVRLQGIDINNPNEIWKHLNEEERQEFEKMVENGCILDLLPTFKPWWVENKPKLIEEIVQDVKESFIPEIKLDFIPFDQLSKKPPSPCLHHHLCNILGAYTCTVRYFNGEHLITPLEASNYLVSLSTALRGKVNFDNFENSVQAICDEAETENLQIALEDHSQIGNDIKILINGKNGHFQLAALSDIFNLLKITKDWKFKGHIKHSGGEFSIKFPDLRANNMTKVELTQYMKKIEFFISYVNSQISK